MPRHAKSQPERKLPTTEHGYNTGDKGPMETSPAHKQCSERKVPLGDFLRGTVRDLLSQLRADLLSTVKC